MKKYFKSANIFLLCFCSFTFTNCDKKPVKLTGSKWKVIEVSLDSNNTFNRDEIVGFKILDSLLKSRNLYSEYKSDIVITHFDGKVPDTMNYIIKKDTIFNIQKAIKDTEIILEYIDNSIVIKSVGGLTTHLVRIE